MGPAIHSALPGALVPGFPLLSYGAPTGTPPVATKSPWWRPPCPLNSRHQGRAAAARRQSPSLGTRTHWRAFMVASRGCFSGSGNHEVAAAQPRRKRHQGIPWCLAQSTASKSPLAFLSHHATRRPYPNRSFTRFLSCGFLHPMRTVSRRIGFNGCTHLYNFAKIANCHSYGGVFPVSGFIVRISHFHLTPFAQFHRTKTELLPYVHVLEWRAELRARRTSADAQMEQQACHH
jgi:hypothetical protein